MSHVQDYLAQHPDIAVSLHYVWLPMFPRIAENRALPNTVQQYADTPILQYWDGDRRLGTQMKARLVPEYEGDVVWDTFLLFDREATWADAPDHLLEWGYTIEGTKDRLFARLESLQEE